jgi:DNA-binding response OmpR family regulator
MAAIATAPAPPRAPGGRIVVVDDEPKVANIVLRHVAPEREHCVMGAGRVTLDLVRRTADVGSGPVALSEREFGVLRHLMTRAGQPCSREALLADVWDMRFDPGTNVVDVYVHRLRDKLGRGLIHTVRSLGYVLDV